MNEKPPPLAPTDSLGALLKRPDSLRAIEAEIRREKAEALGRAGERLDDALEALEGARVAIAEIESRLRGGTGSAEETASLWKAYESLAARLAVLRGRADLAYQYLIIQREAVGVWCHLDVERCYKILDRLA